MPDYAQDYRNRAAINRSFGDHATADWCDEMAAFHEGDADWSDELTDCMVERLGASIARLEGRDG